MELLSLLVRLGITGGQEVSSGLAQVENQSQRTARAINGTGGALSAFKFGSRDALGAAQGLIGTLGGLGTRFAALSGLRASADLGFYKRQLDAVSDSSQESARSFDMLKDVAGKSAFDTAEVFGFAINQIDRFGNKVGGIRTQKVLDFFSGVGGRGQDFGRFQVNLQQISNRGNQKVEAEDFRQLREVVPSIISATSKQLNISRDEADKKLRSMTGNQLTDLIMSIGEKNKGAAEKAGSSDVFTALRNTVDSLNVALAPTGDLISRTVTPLITYGQSAIQVFGKLNDATGGRAGLVAVFGLAVFSMKELMGATQKATAALGALGMMRPGANGGFAPGGGPIGSTGPGTRLVKNADGSMTVTNKPMGFKEGFKAYGPQALRSFGPVALGVGAQAGGAALEGNKTGWLSDLGTALKDAGTGAGMGAAFGPWGAAGGAALGLGYGIYEIVQKHRQAADEMKDAAGASGTKSASEKEQQKQTELLKNISVSLIGGGTQSRSAAQALEIEYAMARAI